MNLTSVKKMFGGTWKRGNSEQRHIVVSGWGLKG